MQDVAKQTQVQSIAVNTGRAFLRSYVKPFFEKDSNPASNVNADTPEASSKWLGSGCFMTTAFGSAIPHTTTILATTM